MRLPPLASFPPNEPDSLFENFCRNFHLHMVLHRKLEDEKSGSFRRNACFAPLLSRRNLGADGFLSSPLGGNRVGREATNSEPEFGAKD